MTHMRFRSSQLCCNTMQFNVSASIFYRRPDMRNPASEKILSAEALLYTLWIWDFCFCSWVCFARLWVNVISKSRSASAVLDDFLAPTATSKAFYFFVNFWERFILRVYNESFAQVPNFGSLFFTMSWAIILIYQCYGLQIVLRCIVICVFDDHDCECPIRKKNRQNIS